MGIILSILYTLSIIILSIIINNQFKSIKELKFHVDLLKGRNKSTWNFNSFIDLDNQFKKSEAELHAKIRYTKIDIQENTKLYLNSWKNSNDFKNMLDLIIKAENSGNQKNNY